MKINISTARSAAYKTLYDVFENKAFSNISLSNHLNSGVKNPADRALCSNIVYGTIKKRNRLTEIFAALSDKPPDKTDARVRVIVLMSLYQLMYLSKVPDYAVVSDAVEMTKFFAVKSASGYVNAILRSFLRRREELAKHEAYDTKQYLYYECGFDEWISEMLLKAYSADKLAAIAQSFEEAPRIYIRVNTLRYTPEQVEELLQNEGIEASPVFVPGVLEIKSGKNIFASQAYKNGAFFAQDISGAISSYVLSPDRGDNILDLCAAPGAKSFGAAILSKGAHITSCDVSVPKLDILYRSAKQMGLDSIKTKKNDASLINPEFSGKFDKVICDVPCSGLGVVRRKPDILLNLTEAHIATLKDIQKKILISGIDALKCGGTLVFSTCTLNPDENIQNIEYALRENNDIFADAIELSFELKKHHSEMKEGMLLLDPSEDGCDGFFIAKLKKVK